MIYIGLFFIAVHIYYYKSVKNDLMPYLNGTAKPTKDPNDIYGGLLMAGFGISIVTFMASVIILIAGILDSLST